MIADKKQQPSFHNPVSDFLNTSDKFRSEQQNNWIRTDSDSIQSHRRRNEVHRNGERAGFEDTEIDRQPFDAVHQQDCDLITLADAAGEQHIGKTVCLFIEDVPGNFATVAGGSSRLN